MSTTEIFLIAMILILGVPFLIWRVFRTDYYAPLVVVQIITGILMGPGVLGAVLPAYHRFVFSPQVTQTLNGIGWWAVMVFVWVAGVELDLGKAWQQRRETGVTATLAFVTPMLLGSVVGVALALRPAGWIGSGARPWQFVLGIGMSCAVTALPILILLMEKLEILRRPLGKRILRYASVDDIAIWGVLGLILMDWSRLSRQLVFLVAFSLVAPLLRRLMPKLAPSDRWYASMVWLAAVAFSADWCGMHFMVGAFLAGVVMDADWFDQSEMDALRRFLLLTGMPVFFLSTGLRTQWGVGGAQVFVVAGALLFAAVSGKHLGVQIAGKLLGWKPGEASLIGWLLQTKALIMIIFANVLLDRRVITNDTFTALLLMAVCSTMLTIPAVLPKLQRIHSHVEEEGDAPPEQVPEAAF